MDDQERKVLEILRDALDVEPDERTTLITERCGNDTALRDRVESMLARIAADAYGQVDRNHAVVTPSDDMPRSGDEAGDAQIGAMLGPFRLIERIGRGGMGIVYRGVREGADFDQQVAIKLIRRGFDFDDIRARFLRERRILARLSHPNLARFIDGGVSDDGRPWFALEFVQGQTITRWSDSHRLGLRERIGLFVDVCTAVQYAHTQLVVHRDLKPGNVLVDEAGSVRLLDFGVAGLLASDGDEGFAPSTIGVRQGLTPEYAAPEQLAGGAIGVSVDIYSLGVIAYELISGVLPFEVDRRDLAAAEQAVRETPPQALGGAITRQRGAHRTVADQSIEVIAERLDQRRESLRSYRRAVRGDLSRMIDKALAKEPERRYSTVQAFADDLTHWLKGEPIRATGNRLGYRLSKFVLRNRVAVGLASLAFLLLLSGTGGVLWKSHEALQEANRANAVKTFLVSLFDNNTPGLPIEQLPTTRELLDRGVARVEKEMSDQPLLQADMLTTFGRIHNQLALHDEADKQLRRALTLEGDFGKADSLHRADTLLELGRSLYERQRNSEAVEIFDQALALVDGNDRAREAEIRELLGLALTAEKNSEQGLQESLRSIALFRTIEEPPGDKVANALSDYASALHQAGRVADALKPQQEALEILRRLYGNEHATVALIASNLGVSLMTLGRFEDAEVPLREAVEVDRKVYGDKNRMLAVHLSNLASATFALGRIEEAEQLMREGVAIRTTLYGEHSPETAKSKISLATVLTEQEKYSEVVAELKPAITTLENAEGDWQRWLANCYNNLGMAQMHLGELAEAEQTIHRAIALRKSVETDPRSKSMVDTESNLGEIYFRQGKSDAAFALYRKLLDESLANLPANTGGLPQRYTQLGWIELELGRYADAKAHYAEALQRNLKASGEHSIQTINSRLGLSESLLKLGDVSAAREQLALAHGAMTKLPAGHSLRRKAAAMATALGESG